MNADNNKKYWSWNKHEPVASYRSALAGHVNDDTLTYGKSKKERIGTRQDTV